MEIEMSVNGQSRSADVEARTLLVHYLRDDLGLTGTNVGCDTSSCGSCRSKADPLRELHDRFSRDGLQILGISYDTERDAMESFRRYHEHSWPTSFTGRRFWEDPVGRTYGAAASGLLYLIEPDGRLDGIYSLVDEVEARLRHHLGDG